MLILLTFFKKYWQLALAALVAGIIFIQHSEVEYWQHKYTQMKQENTALDSRNQKLSVLIEQQNSAVNAIQLQSEQRAKVAVKAVARANLIASRYQKKAQQIQSLVNKSNNQCDELKRIIGVIK